MAWTLQDAKALKGLTVVDPNGERIGKIEDVYLDRHTGLASWATVRTGLFGSKVSFVPIGDARTNPAGDVVVSVTKEQVEHAPRMEPAEALGPDEERRLFEHYGLAGYDDFRGEDRTQQLGLPAEQPPMVATAGAGPPVVAIRLRRLIVVAAPGDPTGVPQ